MSVLATQHTELKLIRLSFYLWLYLVPALVTLSQPGAWLAAVLILGLTPGLWRASRRALRRNRWNLAEIALYALTTTALATVVGAVSSVLGWVSLPCWTLVALEQAHRRERRRSAYQG
jgi:DNA-binding transcriptional LysR family regulator